MAATPPKELLKIMETYFVGPDAHRAKLEALLRSESLSLEDLAAAVIELLHRFALLEFLVKHQVPSALEHQALETRVEIIERSADDHEKRLGALDKLQRALGELPYSPGVGEQIYTTVRKALNLPADYHGPEDNYHRRPKPKGTDT